MVVRFATQWAMERSGMGEMMHAFVELWNERN